MHDLQNHLDNSVQYWRQCLINADRIDIEGNKISEKLDKNIAPDPLPQNVVERLFREYKKQRSKTAKSQDKKLAGAANEIKTVPILYAPVVGRSIKHAAKEKLLIPLWLEAALDLSGHIMLQPDSVPLFEPNCVEPNGNAAFSFGVTREKIDEALSKVGLIPENTDLSSLSIYFEKLFTNELGINFEEIDFSPPYQRTQDRYILLDTEERGLNQALIDVYSAIAETDDKPKLFHKVFAIPRGSVISDTIENHKDHLGHISGQYPLNQGQRKALYADLSLQNGEILAVTGPPGTGKTTLIGNVIASEWVNAAIAQREAPVIFIASTNNQAVQNAIDSFSKIENLPESHPHSTNPALLRRWVEGVEGYGTLFPSSTAMKKEETKKFQSVFRQRGKIQWSGWLCDLEDLGSLEAKKSHYIASAGQAFPSKSFSNVSGVVEFLHSQLIQSKQHLASIIDVRQSILAIRDQYQCNNPEGVFVQTISEINTQKAQLQSAIDKNNENIEHFESHQDQYKKIATQALNLFSPQNLCEQIGSLFLTTVRQKRSTRVIDFLSENKLSPSSWSYDTILSEAELREHLSIKEKKLKQPIIEEHNDRIKNIDSLDNLDQILKSWESEKERYDALIKKWSDVIQETYQHDNAEHIKRFPALIENPNLFDEELDIYHRLFLFILTSHYWEGRWLLDLEKIDNEESSALYGSVQKNIEGFFRRISKLTPCLGSTLHMMPKLFDYFSPKDQGGKPLFDFIDLFIMDEAGQVATEIGMTGLSFAKKALIIGDTDQIEPVRKFGVHEDVKLIKQHGLIDIYDDLNDRGFNISSGNMMQMAKIQSAYSIDEKTRGMFLSDHWRCVPEIISYCNTLVYKGYMNPKKPSNHNAIFPPMGFAHLPGQSYKKGGSRCNVAEAKSIADWINKNTDTLLSSYGEDGKSLKDIIGVVTPFAAQALEIEKALKSAGVNEKIQTGTVHRFQGGEKDVVIFSPVYGKSDDIKQYFFDSGKNMMNVAVSRAKEAFLVFGDMRIFASQPKTTPSGLLGHILLTDPDEKEITDVIANVRTREVIETQCQRIRTLEEHRAALKEALTKSQKRIVIMSAFLSHNAVEQDEIVSLLQQAGERGVKRLVLYDVDFNRDKTHAEKVITLFEEAGVPIHGVHGIHHKTLAYDDEFYMDGSFNWLSAQRDRNHKFFNQEGSLLVRGDEAKEWIDTTWEEALTLVRDASKRKTT